MNYFEFIMNYLYYYVLYSILDYKIIIMNDKNILTIVSGRCICQSESSTENDINMQLAKSWAIFDRLLITWKSDLSDKIKHNFSKQQPCQFYYMDAPHGRWQCVWRKS